MVTKYFATLPKVTFSELSLSFSASRITLGGAWGTNEGWEFLPASPAYGGGRAGARTGRFIRDESGCREVHGVQVISENYQ